MAKRRYITGKYEDYYVSLQGDGAETKANSFVTDVSNMVTEFSNISQIMEYWSGEAKEAMTERGLNSILEEFKITQENLQGALIPCCACIDFLSKNLDAMKKLEDEMLQKENELAALNSRPESPTKEEKGETVPNPNYSSWKSSVDSLEAEIAKLEKALDELQIEIDEAIKTLEDLESQLKDFSNYMNITGTILGIQDSNKFSKYTLEERLKYLQEIINNYQLIYDSLNQIMQSKYGKGFDFSFEDFEKIDIIFDVFDIYWMSGVNKKSMVNSKEGESAFLNIEALTKVLGFCNATGIFGMIEKYLNGDSWKDSGLEEFMFQYSKNVLKINVYNEDQLKNRLKETYNYEGDIRSYLKEKFEVFTPIYENLKESFKDYQQLASTMSVLNEKIECLKVVKKLVPFEMEMENPDFAAYLDKDYTYYTVIDREKFSVMTQQELALYDYLYHTKSAQEAHAYLDALSNAINQRIGAKRAADYIEGLRANGFGIDDLLVTGFDGFFDGIEGFGHGLERFFTAWTIEEGEKSAFDYECLYKTQYLQRLMNDPSYINQNTNKEWYGFTDLNAWYNTGSSIGNMAIPSIVGLAGGGPLSSILFGVSIAGNSAAEAKQNGHSTIQAYTYGIFTGATESITEYVFGFIPGLSSSSKGFLMNLFSEGFEEFVQEYIDAGAKQIFLGEDTGIFNNIEGIFTGNFDAVGAAERLSTGIESFKYGALTTGIMQMGTGAVNRGLNAATKIANVDKFNVNVKVDGKDVSLNINGGNDITYVNPSTGDIEVAKFNSFGEYRNAVEARNSITKANEVINNTLETVNNGETLSFRDKVKLNQAISNLSVEELSNLTSAYSENDQKIIKQATDGIPKLSKNTSSKLELANTLSEVNNATESLSNVEFNKDNLSEQVTRDGRTLGEYIADTKSDLIDTDTRNNIKEASSKELKNIDNRIKDNNKAAQKQMRKAERQMRKEARSSQDSIDIATSSLDSVDVREQTSIDSAIEPVVQEQTIQTNEQVVAQAGQDTQTREQVFVEPVVQEQTTQTSDQVREQVTQDTQISEQDVVLPVIEQQTTQTSDQARGQVSQDTQTIEQSSVQPFVQQQLMQQVLEQSNAEIDEKFDVDSEEESDLSQGSTELIFDNPVVLDQTMIKPEEQRSIFSDNDTNTNTQSGLATSSLGVGMMAQQAGLSSTTQSGLSTTTTSSSGTNISTNNNTETQTRQEQTERVIDDFFEQTKHDYYAGISTEENTRVDNSSSNETSSNVDTKQGVIESIEEEIQSSDLKDLSKGLRDLDLTEYDNFKTEVLDVLLDSDSSVRLDVAAVAVSSAIKNGDIELLNRLRTELSTEDIAQLKSKLETINHNAAQLFDTYGLDGFDVASIESKLENKTVESLSEEIKELLLFSEGYEQFKQDTLALIETDSSEKIKLITAITPSLTLNNDIEFLTEIKSQLSIQERLAVREKLESLSYYDSKLFAKINPEQDFIDSLNKNITINENGEYIYINLGVETDVTKIVQLHAQNIETMSAKAFNRYINTISNNLFTFFEESSFSPNSTNVQKNIENLYLPFFESENYDLLTNEFGVQYQTNDYGYVIKHGLKKYLFRSGTINWYAENIKSLDQETTNKYLDTYNKIFEQNDFDIETMIDSLAFKMRGLDIDASNKLLDVINNGIDSHLFSDYNSYIISDLDMSFFNDPNYEILNQNENIRYFKSENNKFYILDSEHHYSIDADIIEAHLQNMSSLDIDMQQKYLDTMNYLLENAGSLFRYNEIMEANATNLQGLNNIQTERYLDFVKNSINDGSYVINYDIFNFSEIDKSFFMDDNYDILKDKFGIIYKTKEGYYHVETNEYGVSPNHFDANLIDKYVQTISSLDEELQEKVLQSFNKLSKCYYRYEVVNNFLSSNIDNILELDNDSLSNYLDYVNNIESFTYFTLNLNSDVFSKIDPKFFSEENYRTLKDVFKVDFRTKDGNYYTSDSIMLYSEVTANVMEKHVELYNSLKETFGPVINNYVDSFMKDSEFQQMIGEYEWLNYISSDTNSMEKFVCCYFSPDVEQYLFNGMKEKINDYSVGEINELSSKVYSAITDSGLSTTSSASKVIARFIGNKIGVATDQLIADVVDIAGDVHNSNSLEMKNFTEEILNQAFQTENPFEAIEKIKNIFEKNNLPTIGKIFKCFEILHPNFTNFNSNDMQKVSPYLQQSGNLRKRVTIFNDLIRATFGSNNKSVNNYLNNIEFGEQVFEQIKNNTFNIESLTTQELNELITFRNHLATMYENTMIGKYGEETFVKSDSITDDIVNLARLLSPDGGIDYNLGDRLVDMFCGFTGMRTVDQAKGYISSTISKAEQRNIEAANSDMTLEKGDLVKGIGDITHLGDILQNGSVAKEYLGSDADSDLTPLDTDLSIVDSDGKTVHDAILGASAYSYGPIFFVLKNDSRFDTTRDIKGSTDIEYNPSKLELFYTGAIGSDHYGIRTGFASSEINYIVMETYNPRVGLEIAKNGFYIPVTNLDGKVVFTYEDYTVMRQKMSGLDYYGDGQVTLSENLLSQRIADTETRVRESLDTTRANVEIVNSQIKDALIGYGIKTVTEGYSSDLSSDIAEIYSTGSTSRGTNVPGDSDFDYLVKVDREVYFNDDKLSQLKKELGDRLGLHEGPGGKIVGEITTESGQVLDVEISFCPRTDRVEFSTDVALSEKLNAIKEQDPSRYEEVLANIVTAKELLKEAHAYKSMKSGTGEGGLGGIGIENWILQHGGSLHDAAVDFLEVADTCKDFSEFKDKYFVFDLGENHYSDKTGSYPHENFVYELGKYGDLLKMSEEGYERMKDALRKYLENEHPIIPISNPVPISGNVFEDVDMSSEDIFSATYNASGMQQVDLDMQKANFSPSVEMSKFHATFNTQTKTFPTYSGITLDGYRFRVQNVGQFIDARTGRVAYTVRVDMYDGVNTHSTVFKSNYDAVNYFSQSWSHNNVHDNLVGLVKNLTDTNVKYIDVQRQNGNLVVLENGSKVLAGIKLNQYMVINTETGQQYNICTETDIINSINGNNQRAIWLSDNRLSLKTQNYEGYIGDLRATGEIIKSSTIINAIERGIGYNGRMDIEKAMVTRTLENAGGIAYSTIQKAQRFGIKAGNQFDMNSVKYINNVAKSSKSNVILEIKTLNGFNPNVLKYLDNRVIIHFDNFFGNGFYNNIDLNEISIGQNIKSYYDVKTFMNNYNNFLFINNNKNSFINFYDAFASDADSKTMSKYATAFFYNQVANGRYEALNIMRSLTQIKQRDPFFKIVVENGGGTYYSSNKNFIHFEMKNIDGNHFTTFFHEVGHCLFDKLYGRKMPLKVMELFDNAQKNLSYNPQLSKRLKDSFAKFNEKYQKQAENIFEMNIRKNGYRSVSDYLSKVKDNMVKNPDMIKGIKDKLIKKYPDQIKLINSYSVDDLVSLFKKQEINKIKDNLSRTDDAYALVSGMIDHLFFGNRNDLLGRELPHAYGHNYDYFHNKGTIPNTNRRGTFNGDYELAFNEMFADYMSYKFSSNQSAIKAINAILGQDLVFELDKIFNSIINNQGVV